MAGAPGRPPAGKVVRPVPGQQVSLELPDAALDLDRLFGQGADHLRGETGDLVGFTGHRAPDEHQSVRDALRDVEAELGQESPDHVDELGALPNEEITRPMQRQRGLLLDRLDRDKAHGRAGDRLADRLRIASVGLASLHVRLDVGRRHQPNLVTEADQLARPVMARAAGLHADKAGRELAEERDHLRSSQSPPDDHLSRAADRVNLKDVLGQVEADGRDLHRGGSKLVLRDSTTLALQRRKREPSTPSALGQSWNWITRPGWARSGPQEAPWLTSASGAIRTHPDATSSPLSDAPVSASGQPDQAQA